MSPEASTKITLGRVTSFGQRLDGDPDAGVPWYVVDGDESGARVAVFETSVRTGDGPSTPHTHEVHEERIFALEESTVWTVGGRETAVVAGETFRVTPGQSHYFENRGDADASFLAVVTPGILGPDFFDEMAEACAPGSGLADRARIVEIMRRHRLRPAPALD